MAPIMGQFHAQLAESAAERVTRGHFGPGRQGRADVDDEGHPAALMIDDPNAVIVAERAREAHDAGSRNTDARAAPSGQRQPARADAARVDLTEPGDDS